VSRCFSDTAWSVSVRWDPPKGLDRKALPDDFPKQSMGPLRSAKWKPSGEFDFRLRRGPMEWPFLFCMEELVDVLYREVFVYPDDSDQGLILVTGTTNNGKSEVARGLAWKYLQQACTDPRGRRPHLVTYEAPIEKFFYGTKRPGATTDNTSPDIDYTPRQVGLDCHSLEEAFEGALRQTPKVFYVGEIRSRDDLTRSVEFAGTGHLVIATCHAGSLTEAFAKLLTAVSTSDPGTRAIYVPKVLAVVHLRSLPWRASWDGSNGKNEVGGDAIVPAVYRRTPNGLKSVVSDGLAAILPHSPPNRDESSRGEPIHDDWPGSLGRQYFARRLCKAGFDGKSEADACGCEDGRMLHAKWSDVRSSNASDEPAKGITLKTRLIDTALTEDLHGR